MKNEKIHRCSKEIEVIVLQRRVGHEMRLRINGSSVFEATPFAISDPDCIRNMSESLDGYSSTDDIDLETYQQQEVLLGQKLADSMFAPCSASGESLLGKALERALCGLGEHEYVRLLLSFEGEEWSTFPWELTLWKNPETQEEVYLGLDRRIALSRLDPGRTGSLARDARGRDGLLSILNIGADTTTAGAGSPIAESNTLYEQTSRFLHHMSEHIPGLHTASRRVAELWQYWMDSAELTGQFPEIDIVHWNGHGDGRSVTANLGSGGGVKLDAAELLRRTEGAFLYVVLTCNSAGRNTQEPNKTKTPSFSSALLTAGAPAVLGVHDTILANEFIELPILYPMLFLGLPLDYCAQYLRRYFSGKNEEMTTDPPVRWHKLALRTTSSWYLDTAPGQATRAINGAPLLSVAALIRHFRALRDDTCTSDPPRGEEAAAVENAMVAAKQPASPRPDETKMLRRHYDAMLLD